MKPYWILVSALALACPSAGRSEEPGKAAQVKDGPCRADAEKLCPGLKPGDGKFGACMKEHADSLSKGCKALVEGRLKESRNKAQEACGGDGKKHCPGMHPGDGKWGPCLVENRDRLSPSCRGFLENAGARAKAAGKDHGKKHGKGRKGSGGDGDDD